MLFKASSLLALSSHPRARAVAVRTPRRNFSSASCGPSPGPEHAPEFFACRLAAAAADWPLTAASGGDSRGVAWWASLLGRRRSESGRRRGSRAPASCSPAARRAGLCSRPSLRALSEWRTPPVRCSCRPCSRQQSLRSRDSIGWMRGHAEQEFAGERGIMASGACEGRSVSSLDDFFRGLAAFEARALDNCFIAWASSLDNFFIDSFVFSAREKVAKNES